MKKAIKSFCSCGYLGNVLQKFCKTASIILHHNRNASANVPTHAFTLAEIMVVLVVLGILAAILIPTMFKSAPDENVMKFKKAHNNLELAIAELVSNEKYYMNGDLGRMPDGTRITDTTYFCKTLANIVSAKSTNCIAAGDEKQHVNVMHNATDGKKNLPHNKNQADGHCKNAQATMGTQIVTPDGTVWYEGSSKTPFGVYWSGTTRLFGGPASTDESGFDSVYKVICIDVDGIPAGATADNCVNECPFGYGIRSDGKILAGARADEWMAKSPSKK